MNSSQKQKEMMIDKQNDDLELQAMPQPPPDMEKKATEWHDSPQTSMSDMMDDSPTSSTNAAVRPKSTKKGDNDEEEDLNSNKNKGTKEQEDATEPPEQPQRTCVQAIKHSYFQNQFLIHLLIAICVARAYPTLGVKYVAPKITAGWIAVAIIFFLSGIGLRTDEFSKAFQEVWFNGSVQLFNFFVVSACVFGFTRFLIHVDWMDEYLADGMAVCACLPMSVNLVIVLTASADGDEASAVFNTTFSNVVGIFLSPALILGYLGSKADIVLGKVFYQLTLKVIVPLFIGQVIQKMFPPVLDFCKGHKWHLKKAQESCLVFIVYTVFCQTFDSRKNRAAIPLQDIFLMVFFQLMLLLTFMAVSWYLMGAVFPNRPQMRVMSIFGCPSKTIALGIPLINSIYEGNPYLGLYALPILIWHPMQVVVGSLVAPYLARYVKDELARLEKEEDEAKQQHSQEVTAALSVAP